MGIVFVNRKKLLRTPAESNQKQPNWTWLDYWFIFEIIFSDLNAVGSGYPMISYILFLSIACRFHFCLCNEFDPNYCASLKSIQILRASAFSIHNSHLKKSVNRQYFHHRKWDNEIQMKCPNGCQSTDLKNDFNFSYEW